MTMNSINTNLQSMIALQNLNATNSQMAANQKRVSTGFRVADAKDDGGAFAVAQSVRSDVAGVTAANEQIGGIKGVLETTFASLSMVSDTMKLVRTTLTRLADGAITADQRETYEEQYKLLAEQISAFIDDAKYNGRTLLSTNAATGGGNIVAIRNEVGATFTVQATDGATIKLPVTAPTSAADAVSWINSGGTFDNVADTISDTLNKFGSSMKFVDSQMLYNSKKTDALEGGLGALVDADLAKESAMLEALKARQQLGVQTLSLANQGPQVLLRLFQG
jgi:flagellin